MVATPTYGDWWEGHEIDLVSPAIDHLRSIFPEASLHPSSIEAALLESFAVMLGPTAVSLQNVRNQVVDRLMDLYGLERHMGYAAEGKARFKVSEVTEIVEVPAGTILRYYPVDGAALLEYRTIDRLVILPNESLVGEVAIEATTKGVEHNGLPVGSELALVDYMLAVDSVQVSESPRNGEGPESEESWRRRSVSLLARQNSTLTLKDNFLNAALSRPEVGRAFVLDLFNPAAPSTSAPGHVSVAVTDSDGLPLTPREKPVLQNWLQDQALASLQVHVIDPTYTTINPTVVVEAEKDATLSTVEAAVGDALRAWINPRTWNWWDTIGEYDFVSALDDVPGVARIIAVPQDIKLAGNAPLPKLGTVTVQVNEYSRKS